MLSLNNDVSKVILGRLYDWCQRRHKCGTYAPYESGYMYCVCTVFCTSSVYDIMGSSQAFYKIFI